MAFSFYRAFLSPVQKTEDAQREEYILNLLLLASLALSGAAAAIVLALKLARGSSYDFTSHVLPSLLVFLFFCGLLALSRAGRYRVSAYSFLAVYFLLASMLAFIWDPSLPQAIILFTLLIIMAGVLSGSTASVVMTGLIGLSLVSIVALKLHAGIKPDLSWAGSGTHFYDAVTFTLSYGIIALVSWLSNQQIERSLARARRSESELKKERDKLEIKVDERTRELELLQMEKLSQLYRFAELGKVASSILHDLANPLGAVTANLDQLHSGDQEKLLKRVKEGTRRMEKYIEEARRQIRNRKESTAFPVNRQISQAIRSLEARSQELGIPFKYERGGDLYLFGSPVRFQQMVINILANALDSYARLPAAPVVITTAKERGGIRISVADQGSGIPAENLPRIFDPLFSTKGEGGTGLGLSICKEIAEVDYHGTVTAESKPGEGTVFHIWLPEDEPAAE